MNLNKTTGNRSIRGGVLKRQARRPGYYTHHFMGPSILLSATDGSQSARNRPQRPVSILLIPKIQRARPPVACPARGTALRPEGEGRGLRAGNGASRRGRGERGAAGFGAKSKRAGAGLPSEALLACDSSTWLNRESRPLAQVGPAPWSGEGVFWVGSMSGVAEALACRPGEVREWPPPPWLLGPQGGGTYLHPGTGEGHLCLAAGLPLHGGRHLRDPEPGDQRVVCWTQCLGTACRAAAASLWDCCPEDIVSNSSRLPRPGSDLHCGQLSANPSHLHASPGWAVQCTLEFGCLQDLAAPTLSC